MKKLMIAAALVCAAVISQAASVDWDVSNNWTLSDGSSKAAKNTLVYLINGDTSLDTIAAAVSAGNITEQSWFYGSALTSNTKGAVAQTTATSDNLVRNQQYNFSALMVDGDKYLVSDTFAQFAYLNGTDEATILSITTSMLNAGAQTAALPGAQNGWATAAVPEPTSAMLLLLGVAGLALKRKRA